jgi:hypothetical protein
MNLKCSKAFIVSLHFIIIFEPLKVAAMDYAVRIEVFGDSHEYRAPGKPVNLMAFKNLMK